MKRISIYLTSLMVFLFTLGACKDKTPTIVGEWELDAAAYLEQGKELSSLNYPKDYTLINEEDSGRLCFTAEGEFRAVPNSGSAERYCYEYLPDENKLIIDNEPSHYLIIIIEKDVLFTLSQPYYIIDDCPYIQDVKRYKRIKR